MVKPAAASKVPRWPKVRDWPAVVCAMLGGLRECCVVVMSVPLQAPIPSGLSLIFSTENLWP